MDIQPYLNLLVEKSASDLFFTADSAVKLKVEGRVTSVGKTTLTPDLVESAANGIMDDRLRQLFSDTWECDFAIALPDESARFRVNVFRQRGKIAMVIRLIPMEIPTVADLGLPAILNELVMSKRGLILMVGATGSGKSTTLAAMIDHRNDTQPGHILTIEDPIEVVHPSKRCLVNQRHAGRHTGSFARALRAALREDPDIILVGEIRDLETGNIAIKAAQTGHMVMSTLHTNDAPQTLTRMVDMGVKPFAIATAVNIITAQRLARRLHSCKTQTDIPREALLKEGFTEEMLEGAEILRPVGCDECHKGYKGRVGIYEVIKVTPAIATLIMEEGNSMQIAAQAKAEGFNDLRAAALKKVAGGLTSLEEANRITVN